MTTGLLVIFSVCQSQQFVWLLRKYAQLLLSVCCQSTSNATGTTLSDNVEAFKQDHGFPHCSGSVDGTHIPIVSPQQCPTDYYNRKGWHSIILQGTVDHAGRFIDMYVGCPGQVHDVQVFANSSLYRRGQSGTLFPDLKESVAGKEVPFVLLGDPAYPLLHWLMKAFSNNGRLSDQVKLE